MPPFVRPARAASSSSSESPSAADTGSTAPSAPASWGIVVLPARTVFIRRSETRAASSAESEYALSVVVRRSAAVSTSVTPATASWFATFNSFTASPAFVAPAEIIW